MIDVVCAHNPLAVGENRILRLAGNGPFAVKIGCFVTDPPPLGLREQTTQTVEANGSFEVKADQEFWTQHKGGLQVDIEDATGARRRVHFNVQPPVRSLFAVRTLSSKTA